MIVTGSQVGAALAALVLLFGVVPGVAEAVPAPTAAFTSCPGYGGCVMLSRAETKKLDEGGPAKAIGFVGAFCILVPTPGNAICALTAAVAGPGMSIAAGFADDQGRCVGFWVDPINNRIQPVIEQCVED